MDLRKEIRISLRNELLAENGEGTIKFDDVPKRSVKKALKENKMKFPNIDGWYYIIYETEPRIIAIYSNEKIMKGLLINRQHKEPVLKFGKVSENRYGNPVWGREIPWDFDDVENAVRYVYLHDKQAREFFTESEIYDDKKGTIVAEFPEMDNMYVTQKTHKKNGRWFWFFYDADGKWIGTLNMSMWELGFPIPNTDSSRIIKVDFISKKMPPDLTDLSQVARWLYLNVLHKYTNQPLGSNEINEGLYGPKTIGWSTKIINVPDVEGWYAIKKVTEKEGRGRNAGKRFDETTMEIYDSKNVKMGTIYEDGTLHYRRFNHLSPWNYEWVDDEEPWSFKDVKNAVRYVYLRNQEKGLGLKKRISEGETNIEGNEVISFPELGGWTATAVRYTDMSEDGKWVEIDWDIKDSDGESIGFILGDGTFNYVIDDVFQDWDQSNINFKENPEGAARFLWLKRHEREKRKKAGMPLSEAGKTIEPKCGVVKRFKDMPDLGAYYQCGKDGKWKQWVIYTGKGPFSGHIVGLMQTESSVDEKHTGHLLWRPYKNADYKPVGDFNGNVENAVRWIWLKMQEKDDARLKQTGRYV